ncbi:Magnesium chelatase, subunit ChlI [Planctomycetes bacterium K23_9]|uniref:Magnesium chelatase, subunit ChlI n=1 Tax=Stieleria marina TaxID=1930275 RepID=A0A517NNM8_9BACT|nr:Magnesium chelatase, subunit ChlI [Planctomycetes bacterium K23_9]
MLATRMPAILPQLSSSESIETTRIYSALGQLPAGQPLLAKRSFRSPHHTNRDAGWSAVGARQGTAKFPRHAPAFCFWMNFPSSFTRHWEHAATARRFAAFPLLDSCLSERQTADRSDAVRLEY